MGRKILWTQEMIKEGFDKFYKEFGHFPSGPEITNCNYLPSAKQIERRFGGVTKFREMIGLKDTHLGKGSYRSNISYQSGKRGADAEREAEDLLIAHFGEAFVHIEEPISRQFRRVRYDFFIYAKDLKFGIDIFCSNTKPNILKNLDFKIDSYRDVQFPVYFVLGNKQVSQQELDKITKSKTKKPFLSNMKLISWDTFLETVKKTTPLSITDN